MAGGIEHLPHAAEQLPNVDPAVVGVVGALVITVVGIGLTVWANKRPKPPEWPLPQKPPETQPLPPDSQLPRRERPR